jgi:hypothetical protein
LESLFSLIPCGDRLGFRLRIGFAGRAPCVETQKKTGLFTVLVLWSSVSRHTSQKAKKPKRFSKPPVDDVRQYMAELSMNDMSQRFVDYYESNGWKVGKNPMKDWKAAVRTWKQQNNDKQPKQESYYKPLKFD